MHALSPDPMTGLVLGHYRIRSRLGQGGMGSVYLADRIGADYEQRVAIKIATEVIAYPDLLDRFRQERQLLAVLDHPNIVRLIDGGATPAGVPYLVMDCVLGRRITDHCSENRLGVRERVKLIRKVCAAVHYAHQRMVIHRDIKPSNILVTSEGEPKLLDFGIAKILRQPEGEGLTRPDSRPMTLRYASPEQVRGDTLTVASDVYALGTLLYELLCGKTPFEQEDGLAAITLSWKICHGEPPRLSSISELPIDGDLEAIVSKTLRKEPEHRYSSAGHLAEDLLRYLDGRPVEAARGTWMYRLGKFARREKAAAGATIAAAAILTSGVAGVTWQAGIAQRERRVAERRFEDIHELSRSFLFEFHDAIEKLPGALPARRLALEKAVQYLDRLAADSNGDRKLMLDLATGYQRVGYILRSRTLENFGDTEGALANFGKAARLGEQLLARYATDLDVRNSLAGSYRGLGDQYAVRGDNKKALGYFRMALPLVDAAPELRRTRMKVCDSIGDMLVKEGETAQAGPYFEQALAIAESLYEKNPEEASFRRDRTVAWNRMAFFRSAAGDLDGARAYLDRAIAVIEQDVAAKPNDARLRRDLFVGYSRRGAIHARQGANAQALSDYARALGYIERIAASDTGNAQAATDLAAAYLHMGDAQMESNRAAEAAEAYRRGIETAERGSAPDSSAAEPVSVLVNLYLGLGEALQSSSARSGAPAWFAKAIDLAAAYAKHVPSRKAYSMLADGHEAMGDYFKSSGRNAETGSWYEKAGEFRRQADGPPAPGLSAGVQRAPR
ncbi:MAG: protein kinase [Bryobacteraceae bacterium]